MQTLIAYVSVVLAGILNSIHSGTNAELARSLHQPWWCAVLVCVISGLAAGIGVLVLQEAPRPGTDLQQHPGGRGPERNCSTRL
jgi:uncharacterized membrane protein YdcZ (DUF606 family)